MSEPLVEYTIPPVEYAPGSSQCPNPWCLNGTLIGTGEFSMIPHPDGSTTVRHKPSDICYTCGGSGRVFITPAPKR